MGKLLRNLGILIIIIIVLGAAFYFYNGNKLPQLPSTSGVIPFGQKVTLDAGYGEILAIFNNNDVNIVNVQNLSAVGVNSDGAVVWAENKSSLGKVQTQLLDFSKNISSRADSTATSGELSDASKLYASAVGFELKNGTYLETLSKQTNVSADCSNMQYFLDVNSSAFSTYNDLENLATMEDSFIYDHDLVTAQPIVIDLDSQRAAVSDTEDLVNALVSQCNGGSA